MQLGRKVISQEIAYLNQSFKDSENIFLFSGAARSLINLGGFDYFGYHQNKSYVFGFPLVV